MEEVPTEDGRRQRGAVENSAPSLELFIYLKALPYSTFKAVWGSLSLFFRRFALTLYRALGAPIKPTVQVKCESKLPLYQAVIARRSHANW